MKISRISVVIMAVVLAFGCLSSAQTKSQVQMVADATVRIELPDAPSTVFSAEPQETQQGAEPAVSGKAKHSRPEVRGGEKYNTNVADWKFVAVSGSMFTSSVVNAELSNKCHEQNRCSFLPDFMQSRAALYGIGIPLEFGVTYASYKMKEHGSRWWWVPMAAVTAANVAVAYHSAQRVQ